MEVSKDNPASHVSFIDWLRTSYAFGAQVVYASKFETMRQQGSPYFLVRASPHQKKKPSKPSTEAYKHKKGSPGQIRPLSREALNTQAVLGQRERLCQPQLPQTVPQHHHLGLPAPKRQQRAPKKPPPFRDQIGRQNRETAVLACALADQVRQGYPSKNTDTHTWTPTHTVTLELQMESANLSSTTDESRVQPTSFEYDEFRLARHSISL